jgi:hypothetical protein
MAKLVFIHTQKPRDEILMTDRYEGRIKDGGVLLSVHCDTSDEISRAKDLLKQTGAEDISSTGEKAVSAHGVDTETVSTNR